MNDEEEDDSLEEDDGFPDVSPADEIEQAVAACGMNEAETWCAHGGSEYCSYRCAFRHHLKRGTA